MPLVLQAGIAIATLREFSPTLRPGKLHRNEASSLQDGPPDILQTPKTFKPPRPSLHPRPPKLLMTYLFKDLYKKNQKKEP